MDLLSGILMAGSSLIGAASSRSAANAQAGAAKDQLELQREMLDWQTEQTEPWRAAGQSAQPYLNFLAGIGPAPMVGGQAPRIETVHIPGSSGARSTHWDPEGKIPGSRAMKNRPYMTNSGNQAPGWAGHNPSARRSPSSSPGRTEYRVGGQTFGSMNEAQAWANANKTGGEAWNPTLSPLARFRMNEGREAIEGGAAGAGNLFSGNALKRLETMRSGEALADAERLYGKIAGISGQGLNATGMASNAAQNFAQGGSNALANYGDARAAGSMGMANALQGGLNNWMAYNTFNKLMA